MVETSPSNSGGAGSIPGQSLVRELRSHVPLAAKKLKQNRSNIVTNSIKTLNTVHITKILKSDVIY